MQGNCPILWLRAVLEWFRKAVPRLAIMDASQDRGPGLRNLISSGNEAVLEASDYIHYLLNDPHTKVVGAFTEGLKDPEKPLRLADLAIEKEKPLII